MQQHVKQIPAYLLGLLFFGLGGIGYFFKLLPTPENLPTDVVNYMTLMEKTGYMKAIKAFELIGGLLLFFPKTRAAGLCIIVPIAINVLFYEVFIAKEAGIGIACVVLSILAIYFNKEKFANVLPKL